LPSFGRQVITPCLWVTDKWSFSYPILEDNTEVTHQKDILVQQKLFYQTLYESRGTIFTDEHLKSLFDDINPYISKSYPWLKYLIENRFISFQKNL
jgi:hypothetical protein